MPSLLVWTLAITNSTAMLLTRKSHLNHKKFCATTERGENKKLPGKISTDSSLWVRPPGQMKNRVFVPFRYILLPYRLFVSILCNVFSGAPFCLLHLQWSKTSTTFKDNLTNLFSKNTKINIASCTNDKTIGIICQNNH